MTDKLIELIKVIPTRDGFYQTYRKAGSAAFYVAEHEFSKHWMVHADSKQAEAFLAASKGKELKERDAITGERLTSGGMAEQLALLLEQNAELQRKLTEIDKLADAPTEEPREPTVDPEVIETKDEAPTATGTGERRRRANRE